MPILAKDKPKREPMPDGVYIAVCYSVVDLGTHYDEKFARDRRSVNISWEIPELRIKFSKDGEEKEGPRVFSKEFTLSLGAKSALEPFLVAWRGRPFTDEERNGFDVSKLIGAGAQLNIITEVKSNGDKRNKIAAIMRLPKGMVAPKSELPTVNFSLDSLDTPTLPAEIPEWLQKKIVTSNEYVALCQRHNQPEPEETPEATDNEPAPNAAPEDDVPF